MVKLDELGYDCCSITNILQIWFPAPYCCFQIEKSFEPTEQIIEAYFAGLQKTNFSDELRNQDNRIDLKGVYIKKKSAFKLSLFFCRVKTYWPKIVNIQKI